MCINRKNEHIIKCHSFSNEIKILKTELSNLIDMVRRKEWPFQHEDLKRYYAKYQEIKSKV